MADEILSEDELNDLLDSLEDAENAAPSQQKRIVDYDFARPDKLNAEQIRSLQRLHEGIAQDLETQLSRLLRVALEVSLVSLGQLSFDVFRNSLSNPTVLQVMDMQPSGDRAILTMDIKLAFSVIDRMLGGPGKALEQVRPLTVVEESLLDNVSDRFLDRITNGWEKLQQFSFEVIERESDPQFAQVIPPAEMVLVATFGVQSPGEIESGEVCYCIPFISLEEAFAKLSSQTRFADLRRPQTDQQRQHLDRVVAETAVPVSVDLGNTTLSIGEILALKQDDVLVLDQPADQPLNGFVSGNFKLQGRPGKVGRKVGFQLDLVIPDGANPKLSKE